jgi:hypothetical protein
MDNDKTLWAPRWSPKGCESSWKPAGTQRERASSLKYWQQPRQDETRRGDRSAACSLWRYANPPNKMQRPYVHSLWVRLSSSRPQPSVARLLPKGPSQPRKPASTPDLDSERGDGASPMPTSVDDVPREASLAFVSISTCRARSERGFPFGAAMRRAGVDPWLLEANPGARLTNT